jgi:glycogen phosphorylase
MSLLRDLPPRLAPLRDLALDLRWTWSHQADALWERIDAGVWERTRNPWTILSDVPAHRFTDLAADAVSPNWTDVSRTGTRI